MCSLLLFAVLLTVLLQPAVASSPIMDLVPPGSPLDSPYSIHGLMLCACGSGIQYELCYMCLGAMPQLPYNNAAAPEQAPDPTNFDMLSLDTFEMDPDMAPVLHYVTGDNGTGDNVTEDHNPPTLDEFIQLISVNETTVQPTTVQAHIEDTYTPGDRSSSHLSKPRKRAHKRQAPRERGFVCKELECAEVFNRQCDLNRHRKTSHLNERPHVCPTCDKGFLYPKDLRRHKRRHSDPSSIMVTFRCDHPDCSNLDGFSRKDNLQRHQRRQHPPQ